MTIVVIDLEWSQPVCKEKMLYRDGKPLPVEIIQIGAVAVRDGEIIEETFSSYVRPVFYTKIKGRIQKLTGIREETLRSADDFQTVMAEFRKWYEKVNGEMISMWGNEDVRFLIEQCRFFGMETSWIKSWFNLQPIFTRQYKIERDQIGLNTAVEIADIKSDLDYHSAINDAYYTALILQKVENIADMIAWQKKVDVVHANPIKELAVTRYSSRSYSRVSSAMTSQELKHCLCPLCGRRTNLKGKLVCARPRYYLAVIKCAKHTVSVKVNFIKNADGKFTWTRELSIAQPETERLYNTLLRRRNEKKAEHIAIKQIGD